VLFGLFIKAATFLLPEIEHGLLEYLQKLLLWRDVF
jgi:hypothetical protein